MKYDVESIKRRNKNRKRITKIIDVFLVILIYNVILVMFSCMNKIEQVNIFGYEAYIVTTDSMKPSISSGDVVIVKITKEVQENEIIVYSEDNNFITHRLITKDENGKFITKGDANNSEDKPIEEAQILGKVIYIIPKIGIFKRAILSPQVLILILTLIILLGMALKLTTNKGAKDEQK